MTPPREERHQSAAVIRSSDLGFPPEVAESGLELLHGDAFKKGTTQIAPPPPALAEAEGKFSPRSVRRNPTLVHGPPSPPAPPGRPWSTGRSAIHRHHRIQIAGHAGPPPSPAPSGSETKLPSAHRDRRGLHTPERHRDPSARHRLSTPTAARALAPPWSHQIGEGDVAHRPPSRTPPHARAPAPPRRHQIGRRRSPRLAAPRRPRHRHHHNATKGETRRSAGDPTYHRAERHREGRPSRAAQDPCEGEGSPAAADACAGFARRRPLAAAREEKGEKGERRRRSRVPSGPLAGAARGTGDG